MYRILGGDGKEYGPVSADQIRQWFREGRADARTQLCVEGTAQWRALGEFTEFADLLIQPGAGSPPRTAPPVSGTVTVDVNAVAAELNARGSVLAVGSCFSRAWRLVTEQFWLTIGVVFVGSIVEQVPFIFGVMHAGLFWYFLKRIRGEEAKFEDAFSAFSTCFLPTFLAGIVLWLLVALGLVFCVIPGLALMVLWTFTWPILVDRRLDFWPAMELSRKVAWPNFWSLVGLWLLSLLVIVLGALCCYVGIFVAMPVVLAAQAYAYEDLFGRKDAAAS